MVVEHDARVIVMATSATGMPEDAEERLQNANTVIEHVKAKGRGAQRTYLSMPSSSRSRLSRKNGNHYFDAVRALREAYGDEVHIGGGLSNVSFGMPKTQTDQRHFHLPRSGGGHRQWHSRPGPEQDGLDSRHGHRVRARETRQGTCCLGMDDFCMGYIQAFRDGRLG